MTLDCIENHARVLGTRHLALGFTDRSRIPLKVGKEYVALGMILWGGVLAVLVFDEDGLPSWYPLEFFAVRNSALSPDWRFTKGDSGERSVQAIWGYEELVVNGEHYDELNEREPRAIEIARRALEAAKGRS